MNCSNHKLEETNVKENVVEFDNKGRYKKGSSAGSKGVEYQVGLLVVILLNASRKLKTWRLSTENEEAGKFDDAVLEWPEGSILVQAKHRDSKTKRITLEELISANSKKDDFSLAKYFLSYQKVKEKFKNIHQVIISTDADVSQKVLPFLNSPTTSPESILYHETGDCPFYTFNDNILPDLKKNVVLYLRQNSRNKGVDESVITDVNLKDFLRRLQIYFNYLPQDKLDDVIDDLLSVSRYGNNIHTSDVTSKVKDWFQQKDGEYLNETQAKAKFAEIRTDKYFQVLKQFNVSFGRNSLSFEGPIRTFQVVCEGNHLLQTIKIYHSLPDKSKVLCIDTDDDAEVLQQVVEAFQLPRYTFLMIVLSESIEDSEVIEISEELKKTLKRCDYKKVILVSQYEKRLCQQFVVGNSYGVIRDSVTLDDLSPETQKRLLKEKNVVFQGKNVNLEQLFPSPSLQILKKAIRSEVLENLVRGDKIAVGSKVRPLDNQVVSCYIDRIFQRPILDGQESSGDVKKRVTIPEEQMYEVGGKVVLIEDIAGAGKTTVLDHLAGTIKKKNLYLWIVLIRLNDYTGILNEFKERSEGTITITELMNSRKATRLTNELEELVFSDTEKIVLLLDGVDEISPDYTNLVLNMLTLCQKGSNFAKVFVTTRPHMARRLEDILHVKSFTLQPFTRQSQISFLTNYWFHNLGLDECDRKRCELYGKELLWRTSSWSTLYNEYDFAATPLQVKMLAEIFQENNRLEGLTGWQGCKEFLSGNNDLPELPKKMDVAKVYDIFIEKKRTIFKIKGNPSGNTTANLALLNRFDEFLVYHRKLALEEVLQQPERELFMDCQQGDRDMEEILKIGIVQKLEDNFYFSHRTFAEYFVAQSVLNELQPHLQSPKKIMHSLYDKVLPKIKKHNPNRKTDFQKFFFNQILLSSNFRVVRKFFNNFLQQVVDSIPLNVFQHYKHSLYEFNLSASFNLVHLLAAEGSVAILELLFRCVDFKVIRDREVRIGDAIVDYPKRSNTLKVLKFLLQEGGVNIRNIYDQTPLFCASQLDEETVKFFVNCGANKLDRMLYGTIQDDNVEMVRFFLEKILEGSYTENSLLAYTFAYLGLVDKLKDLVQKGLNVDMKVENDESLIFGAARGGQLNVIRFLVEQNVDINSRDAGGSTALHSIAGMPSRTATAGLLLQSGIDVNAKNKSGYTPLHCSTKNLDMVELLVSNGANVNITNEKDETPLWEAIWWGQLDTVKFLVARGCDLHVRNFKGRTPLKSAIEQGESNIATFLRDCLYISGR